MPDDSKVIVPEGDQLVPAIDISVVVAAGDNRQVQLKTCILQSTTEADAHRIVDKLMALGDRQKARYDLEKETEEMDKVSTTLTALIAGLPIAQANYLAQKEKRLEEFRGYEAEYEKLHTEGYNEHVASGRSTGGFVPKGARKSNMERQRDAGKKVKETIDREKAEATQLFENNMKSVEHYRDDLGKRREKVNGLRSLVGLEPFGAFDCEICALPASIEA